MSKETNMKAKLIVLCFCLTLWISCRKPEGRSQRLTQRQVNEHLEKQREVPSPPITEEAAIKVAKDDAKRILGKLDEYEISASEQTEGWHVRFKQKMQGLEGDGALYIIDKETGKLLDIKLYQ